MHGQRSMKNISKNVNRKKAVKVVGFSFYQSIGLLFDYGMLRFSVGIHLKCYMVLP